MVLTALFFVGLKQSGHSVALRMTRQSSLNPDWKADSEKRTEVNEDRARGDIQEVAISLCFWMGKGHADLECTLKDKTGHVVSVSVPNGCCTSVMT